MNILNSIDDKLYFIKSGDIINWYCCGPTIYNDSHLGHARTYIIFDSMIRFLRSQNVKINYGMNITDIDDKIVKKVHEMENILEHKQQIKDTYNHFIKVQENSFWTDLEKLNIIKPDKILRVSNVIPEIINFIEKLISNNYAYVSNGSVYFSTSTYLSKFSSIMSNSNDGDNSVKNTFNSEKNHPNDFALWKAEKETDISWKSPWGYGRPGWHIECSVMMDKMFSDKIDVHSGGIDLKFPHHHNEYLQTTAFYEKENLIKCFVHSGHLHINKEKMSQSLGNFITIKNFLKNNNANTMRLLFLLGNWSGPLDLTDESLNIAKSYDKIYKTFLNNLEFYGKNIKEDIESNQYDNFKERIIQELSNNFNTIEVVKIVQEFITKVNIDYKENKIDSISKIKDIFNFVLDIFGLKYEREINENNSNIEQYIESIIQIRNEIRYAAKLETNKESKKRLFGITDKIRDEILPNLGIKLEDTNGIDKWFFL